MERLTISLDDELARALDALQADGVGSKAMIVRRALRDFLQRQLGGERPTELDLRVWTDLLANREHAILDVAHIRLLFQHCADAPPEFWRELHEIGVEHGRQYRDKGLTSVPQVLAVIEAANWFHVAPEGERSWTLVFLEPSAKPFLRTFLTGFFSEYPGEPQIVEERTKLRVRLAAPPVRASATRRPPGMPRTV